MIAPLKQQHMHCLQRIADGKKIYDLSALRWLKRKKFICVSGEQDNLKIVILLAGREALRLKGYQNDHT